MEKKLHLMIVDDEPIVGKRLKRLFEKEGFIVETYTRGSVAIEELHKKPFDIVITDLMMGIVDGMKVLESAITIHPSSKVIIITGFSKKETALEALNKGAFDFIIKPFKIEDLRKVIQKATQALLRKI